MENSERDEAFEELYEAVFGDCTLEWLNLPTSEENKEPEGKENVKNVSENHQVKPMQCKSIPNTHTVEQNNENIPQPDKISHSEKYVKNKNVTLNRISYLIEPEADKKVNKGRGTRFKKDLEDWTVEKIMDRAKKKFIKHCNSANNFNISAKSGRKGDNATQST